MKRDKKFQEQVDNLIYVEGREEFFKQAHTQIRENRAAKRKSCERIKATANVSAASNESVNTVQSANRLRLYIILAVVALCLISVVIILTASLSELSLGDKFYSYGGDTEAVSIEQLNANSEIQFNEVEGVKVSCAYDTVYHEELFYILSYSNDDTLENLTVIVKTNKEFDYGFIDPENWDKTVDLKGYIINYNEDIEIEDDIYFISISGKIECGDEIIYISYEGISLEEQSNFLSLLQILIK